MPQARCTSNCMNKMEKPSKIRRICVYCGSGPGIDPAFVESARAFGALLAKNGIGLVFGGGSVGMMGTIAKSVLEHGGEVTGIIPEFLVAREHAMRGAIGTLEEVVEQITWVQLGRHRKPILIANIKHFWDPLCALINHMKALEFIRDDLSFELLVADNVDDILP